MANRPSASGGAIQRYTVDPQLPTGLVLDAGSGVISGTPTAVSAHAVYTVTAENAAGRTTTRVEIEVRQSPALPTGLSYGDIAPIYTVGQTIAPNAPTSSGGPITHYSITPALPAGLSLEPISGVISGTPTVSTVAADYAVTGTNAAGSVTVTLRLAVQPAPVAPANLTYTIPAALYVTTEPITPNTAQVTGGPATTFSIAPSLPAGLSINTTSGAITGTPDATQSQVTYTVTASNSAGSAQTQVSISITARGSWSAAAPIPTGRHYAPAVTLANGKVLVAGGMTSTGPINSAVIYDPATDAWASAAPMLTARSDASATVLADGRVLVAGGDAAGLASLASVEIYDPIADTWTATASMNEARTRHTASLLPSGKLLVIGGYRRVGAVSFTQTAELYDPATGIWTPMATTLSSARAQHGGQLLADGSAVLVIGGVNSGGHLASAELFPVDDSGSTTPVTGTVPGGNVYTSVRLADGSVLALADTSTTAVRFHPATSSWTTSTLATNGSRILPTMTLLSDGRVLLAGGGALAAAEIYNPDVNTWTAATSMSNARGRAAACLLSDGSVLVIGGASGSGELASVERFTP